MLMSKTRMSTSSHCSKNYGEAGNTVVFFGGARQHECPLLVEDVFGTFMQSELKLESAHIDFLLTSIWVEMEPNIRNDIFVLPSNSSRHMQMRVDDHEVPGMGLEEWGNTHFKMCGNNMKVLVVPYLSDGHWSLLLIDDSYTLHLDSIRRFHAGEMLETFARAVRRCWAWRRGLQKCHEQHQLLLSQNTTNVEVPAHNSGWQCGYHVVFNFGHYTALRTTFPGSTNAQFCKAIWPAVAEKEVRGLLLRGLAHQLMHGNDKDYNAPVWPSRFPMKVVTVKRTEEDIVEVLDTDESRTLWSTFNKKREKKLVKWTEVTPKKKSIQSS